MLYMYTRFKQLAGHVNDAQFRIDNTSQDPMRRHMRQQYSSKIYSCLLIAFALIIYSNEISVIYRLH